jgi:hypothetical protein
VTKLKMNIATKEDLKAENGRLKRELKVREKAIEDLELKIEDEYVSKKEYNKLQEKLNRQKSYEMACHNQHSSIIQLDAELENIRDKYNKVLNHNVNLVKENEHLRGLVKLWV